MSKRNCNMNFKFAGFIFSKIIIIKSTSLGGLHLNKSETLPQLRNKNKNMKLQRKEV
jgi:hypothetical protein